MGVLDGVRVIDFGRYIAGPYCGALLGDLGADVIRVERVEGGEDRWITPVTSDGVGAMYLQCNRGKRGMTLDVVKPEGREVVARLVALGRRRHRQPAGRDAARHGARLRHAAGHQARHHPDHGERVGVGRRVEPQGRLRRPGPGGVGQPVPVRSARPAVACGGARTSTSRRRRSPRCRRWRHCSTAARPARAS